MTKLTGIQQFDKILKFAAIREHGYKTLKQIIENNPDNVKDFNKITNLIEKSPIYIGFSKNNAAYETIKLSGYVLDGRELPR